MVKEESESREQRGKLPIYAEAFATLAQGDTLGKKANQMFQP
jgi:hypothetical protein